MHTDKRVVSQRHDDRGRFRLSWSVRWLASVLVVALAFGLPVVRAADPNRVGLVVVHGDGRATTRCVEFSEDTVSGYDVLARAGLELSIDASNSMGVTICRIGADGCTYPQDRCFCQCTDLSGTVPCVYWSYWHLQNGGWQYSGMGASGHMVRPGDVEGWVWGAGTPNSASQPPAVSFDQLCPASGSSPPTVQPSSSTAHDHKLEPPVISQFTADRKVINPGESVLLDWELHDAKQAFLVYDGVQQGIEGDGINSQLTVAPTTTTTYTLLARNDEGETSRQVVISVSAAPPAATDTPLPAPTASDTPAPAPTATRTSTPVPTATPSPTVTATPPPTSTPVLPPSPVPARNAPPSTEPSGGTPSVTPRLKPVQPTAARLARRTAAAMAGSNAEADAAARPFANEERGRQPVGSLVVVLGLAGTAVVGAGVIGLMVLAWLVTASRSRRGGPR